MTFCIFVKHGQNCLLLINDQEVYAFKIEKRKDDPFHYLKVLDLENEVEIR